MSASCVFFAMLFQTHLSMNNLDRRLALGLGAASVVSGAYFTWSLSKWSRHKSYQQECSKLKKARDDKIDALERKLQSLNLNEDLVKSIAQMPLVDLVNRIKSGQLSAVDVLHTYQQRALKSHKLTNCLTNVFVEAEEWAIELDKRKSKEGLLYGVPVSIKDNLTTKGHVNSRGCVVFKDDIPTEDALIVKTLKEQGAVPFVKTNIPQLMMGVETSNAIYGVTCNPLDITRSPGGSSGGEGALIASGGSILGMGADLGGSIRIPSTMCGLCGIKPSSERISKKGIPPYGQTIVRSCWGPMARDVDSLVLAMQSILGPTMFENDKTTPPMPFNLEMFKDERSLNIGYYVHDEVQPATPAAVRAVMEVKQLLEDRGHKLIQWTPPDLSFGYVAAIKSLSGDRGFHFRELLRAEEIYESIKMTVSTASLSNFQRFLVAKYLKWRGEDFLVSGIQAARGVGSVSELFSWTSQVKNYVQRFGDAWNESELDAVICPAFAHQAITLSSTTTNPLPLTYTIVYSLLDYVAGVVPVTSVNQDDIYDLKGFPSNTWITRYLKQDMQGSMGLPVCVQCVTPMWREETCLKLMKEVEQAVQYDRNMPSKSRLVKK